MANYVEYRHNNSGGRDWLTKDHWNALIKAGWIVADHSTYGDRIHSVKRTSLSLHDAIVEWQKVTGLDPAATGCNCCGRPHSFYEYDENDNFVACMNVNYGVNTWEIGGVK